MLRQKSSNALRNSFQIQMTLISAVRFMITYAFALLSMENQILIAMEATSDCIRNFSWSMMFVPIRDRKTSTFVT